MPNVITPHFMDVETEAQMGKVICPNWAPWHLLIPRYPLMAPFSSFNVCVLLFHCKLVNLKGLRVHGPRVDLELQD